MVSRLLVHGGDQALHYGSIDRVPMQCYGVSHISSVSCAKITAIRRRTVIIVVY